MCFYLQDDAIVNSVITPDFDLSKGYLSRRLLSQAGSELQTACKKHGAIGVGEVVETDSYQLPCKKILHCHLTPYDKSADNAKVKLILSYTSRPLFEISVIALQRMSTEEVFSEMIRFCCLKSSLGKQV